MTLNWTPRPCMFCTHPATVIETSTYPDGRVIARPLCDTCRTPFPEPVQGEGASLPMG